MLLYEYLNDIKHMKEEYLRVKKENINIPKDKGIHVFETHEPTSCVQIPVFKNYSFALYTLLDDHFSVIDDTSQLEFDLYNDIFSIEMSTDYSDVTVIEYNLITKNVTSMFEEIKTVEDFNEEILFYLKLQEKI